MIKNYIIKKLKEWLELQSIKDSIGSINRNIQDLDYENTLNRKQIVNLNKVLDIGVDIGVRDHQNWAVICVEGKPEYVKFIDLNRGDVREIQRFLKQFEGSRNKIDCPYGMDFMFKDDVLWGRK